MTAGTDKELSVDTAISLVLEAEQDALAHIAACEDRADRVLRDARETIRAAVRRTEERISRLHTACARRNRELIAELEKSAAGETTPDRDDAAADWLTAAVDATARQLTTREPDGVD